MLLDLQNVLTVWKRPAELLPSISDIPMHVPNPLSAADSTSFAGKLFCGHSALRWLCACFNSIQEVRVRQATCVYQTNALSRLPEAASQPHVQKVCSVKLQGKMPSKGLLWQQIHPQDSKNQPVKSSSGRYHVKCFVMGDWRRVTVDDCIPVDAFGAPLLVGSMPTQLWPLILSKAVIKLMTLCQVGTMLHCQQSALLPQEYYAISCIALMPNNADLTMFAVDIFCNYRLHVPCSLIPELECSHASDMQSHASDMPVNAARDIVVQDKLHLTVAHHLFSSVSLSSFPG